MPARLAATLAFLALLGTAGAARADPPELSLPIACTPGIDCWIVHHVDLDPGPGVADPACGTQTYDGHKGTDFAVRSVEAMERGVEVLAAADGTVVGVRDGEADAGAAHHVPGRECGNGVNIDHGNGWSTLYCHMKRGSVRVAVGGRVARGDAIGQVGLSGMTDFPHVHMGVIHGGQDVDPFTGRPVGGACGLAGAMPLWSPEVQPALPYRSVALFNAGFAGGPVPTDLLARRQNAVRLPAESPGLVLWAEVFGSLAGDAFAFTIVDPQGRAILDQRVPLDSPRRYRIVYNGLKTPAGGWQDGRYLGTVRYLRGMSEVECLRSSTLVAGGQSPVFAQTVQVPRRAADGCIELAPAAEP